MEDKFLVAIEIGSSKIKGALASAAPGTPLNVIAVQEEPMIDAVRYGQIKNVEEVSGRIDRMRRHLENAPALTQRKIRGVYVGLSGLTLGSTTATARIDFDNETEITSSIIEELRNRARNSIFSDKEVFDVIPRSYVVDNLAMANPVGTFAKSIKATFTIITGSAGLMSNIRRVLPERLQLSIVSTILSPIAQAEAVLTEDERRLGSAFVDFGAETTTIAIYKDGTLQYLVTLPMGSRNITRDLMALGYLEERAEDIKRVNGLSFSTDDSPRIAQSDNMDQAEINGYIAARAGEIVANIIAQIEYAEFKPTDLRGGIVIVGGGARLKGFSDLLAQQSRMSVRTGVLPRNLRISDTSVVADDAVDVISLLIGASERTDTENCVETPARQQQYDDSFHIQGGNKDANYNDTDEDDLYSRVGNDDDDILADDPDDDDFRPARKPVRTPIVEESRKKKEKKEKKRGESAGSKFFSLVRDRLASLVSDPDEDDDHFDDDEEDDSNN